MTDPAALAARIEAATAEQQGEVLRGEMSAICTRCGIDLFSGADCALEGYVCLGSEGEMEAEEAERQRAALLAMQEAGDGR